MSFELVAETLADTPHPNEELIEFMGVADISLDRLAARNTVVMSRAKQLIVVEFKPKDVDFNKNGKPRVITRLAARMLCLMVQAPPEQHPKDQLIEQLVGRSLMAEKSAHQSITKGSRELDSANLGISLIEIGIDRRSYVGFELFDLVFKPEAYQDVPVNNLEPENFSLDGAITLNVGRL